MAKSANPPLQIIFQIWSEKIENLNFLKQILQQSQNASSSETRPLSPVFPHHWITLQLPPPPLTTPPLFFRKIARRGGGLVSVISPDILILYTDQNHGYTGNENGNREQK